MQVQIRTLSNNVVLRPVIEMSPEELGGSDSPFRQTSAADWLSCLKAAGIPATREVVAGSWLVDADDIVSPRALRSVLEAHLGSPDGKGAMLPLSESALQGGFVLEGGEEAILVPGCCGHLGSLKEWRRAAEHRGEARIKLRLGHPELSATFEGGMVCLHEKHDEEHQNQPKTVRVRPDVLAGAVDIATLKVAALMARLRTASSGPRKLGTHKAAA